MPRTSMPLAVFLVLVLSAGVFVYGDAVVDTALQICDGFQYDNCGIEVLPGLIVVDHDLSVRSKNKITVNVTMGRNSIDYIWPF